MASFNTTVRQMTEMSQRPKCLNKKWPKRLSEIKPALHCTKLRILVVSGYCWLM